MVFAMCNFRALILCSEQATHDMSLKSSYMCPTIGPSRSAHAYAPTLSGLRLKMHKHTTHNNTTQNHTQHATQTHTDLVGDFVCVWQIATRHELIRGLELLALGQCKGRAPHPPTPKSLGADIAWADARWSGRTTITAVAPTLRSQPSSTNSRLEIRPALLYHIAAMGINAAYVSPSSCAPRVHTSRVSSDLW